MARIPSILFCAIALSAVLVLIAMSAGGPVGPILAAGLHYGASVTSALTMIGLFQISARSEGRVALGAQVGAVGAGAIVVGLVVANLSRGAGVDSIVPLAAVVEAAGYAIMVSGSSNRLAGGSVILVAIRLILPSVGVPPPMFSLAHLGQIAITVAILRRISPAIRIAMVPLRGWPLAAATLFCTSLAMPALALIDRPLFGHGSEDQLVYGITCVLYGWFPPYTLGWLANPLLAAAALAYRTDRPAGALTLVGLALGSAALAPMILDHEGLLRYPHVGYVAWVASMICLGIAAARKLRVRSL